MLKGCDVSGWQDSLTSKELQTYDFCLIKATEGKDYTSGSMQSLYKKFTGCVFDTPSNKNYGFYHFARPDLNEPETEASNYISTIKQHIGSCVLILDYEKATNKGGVNWAERFLDYVFNKTGVRPILYVNSNELRNRDYSRIKNKNYGLWIANYGKNDGNIPRNIFIKPWNLVAFHQYTSVPYDKDIFFGNESQFKKYCKPCVHSGDQWLKSGDKVKVTSRKDYNGVKNDSWVLNTVFTVIQINGKRVVVGRDGKVTGAWRIEDIKRV